MNPGLPGIGIGGLFYILSAICMPARELARWYRYRQAAKHQWRLVASQFAMALGIVVIMSSVFWLIDAALGTEHAFAARRGSDGSLSIRVSALALTAGMLATVLGAMHIARIVIAAVRPR